MSNFKIVALLIYFSFVTESCKNKINVGSVRDSSSVNNTESINYTIDPIKNGVIGTWEISKSFEIKSPNAYYLSADSARIFFSKKITIDSQKVHFNLTSYEIIKIYEAKKTLWDYLEMTTTKFGNPFPNIKDEDTVLRYVLEVKDAKTRRTSYFSFLIDNQNIYLDKGNIFFYLKKVE